MMRVELLTAAHALYSVYCERIYLLKHIASPLFLLLHVDHGASKSIRCSRAAPLQITGCVQSVFVGACMLLFASTAHATVKLRTAHARQLPIVLLEESSTVDG